MQQKHRSALSRTPRVPAEPVPHSRAERMAQIRECVHDQAMHPEKLTHRLQPQACVIYVPSAGMYVVDFSPTKVRLIELPALARQYDEDEAASAAMTFREITGLPVTIRPYYAQQ